jgi:hypothetical protein
MEDGMLRTIGKCAIQRSTLLKVSEQEILMWLFLKTGIKKYIDWKKKNNTEKKRRIVELLIVRTYERGPEFQGRGPLNLWSPSEP